MIRTLILLIVFAATPVAAEAPRAELELLPHARVTDGHVVLGDVVRLHSGDLALARKLVNLPVGPSPQPGESALVHREALADWVRRSTGLAAETLRWAGADAARVMRTSRQLRGEEIAEAAIEGVRRAMSPGGQHADLRVRAVVRDIEMPEGRVQLRPRPTESGVGLRNRVLVWVDAWVDDRFVRSFPVTVEVAGTSVRLEQAAGGGRGHSVTQQVSAADASAVSRGEWAALRTTSGAVSLESRVEVLQDGRVGQRVRVRASANASGILFAKVVGRGQLELAP